MGSCLLFANEPSVYGAGDIDSSAPYGLTTTEQNVLNNRKQVQELGNQVSGHQSRISGLTTVVEGLTKQVLELKEQLKESREREKKREDEESKQEEDYKKSYTLLLELGKMIDEINSNYVTKDALKEDLSVMYKELSSLSQQYTSSSQSYQEQPIMNASTPNNNGLIIDGRERYGNNNNQLENQPYNTGSSGVSEVYREAVQLFSHKSYLSSSEKFKEVISQNYKVAPSNYYLGEIAYYTNDYYSAISYYKKSASTYDKASYMKTLYLHTALSLSRTGQHEQAKGFFRYVLDNYPGTKSAEIAEKNL